MQSCCLVSLSTLLNIQNAAMPSTTLTLHNPSIYPLVSNDLILDLINLKFKPLNWLMLNISSEHKMPRRSGWLRRSSRSWADWGSREEAKLWRQRRVRNLRLRPISNVWKALLSYLTLIFYDGPSAIGEHLDHLTLIFYDMSLVPLASTRIIYHQSSLVVV